MYVALGYRSGYELASALHAVLVTRYVQHTTIGDPLADAAIDRSNQRHSRAAGPRQATPHLRGWAVHEGHRSGGRNGWTGRSAYAAAAGGLTGSVHRGRSGAGQPPGAGRHGGPPGSGARLQPANPQGPRPADTVFASPWRKALIRPGAWARGWHWRSRSTSASRPPPERRRRGGRRTGAARQPGMVGVAASHASGGLRGLRRHLKRKGAGSVRPAAGLLMLPALNQTL